VSEEVKGSELEAAVGEQEASAEVAVTAHVAVSVGAPTTVTVAPSAGSVEATNTVKPSDEITIPVTNVEATVQDAQLVVTAPVTVSSGIATTVSDSPTNDGALLVTDTVKPSDEITIPVTHVEPTVQEEPFVATGPVAITKEVAKTVHIDPSQEVANTVRVVGTGGIIPVTDVVDKPTAGIQGPTEAVERTERAPASEVLKTAVVPEPTQAGEVTALVVQETKEINLSKALIPTDAPTWFTKQMNYGSGISAGAAAGIFVAVLIVLIAVVVAIFLVTKKDSPKSKPAEPAADAESVPLAPAADGEVELEEVSHFDEAAEKPAEKPHSEPGAGSDAAKPEAPAEAAAPPEEKPEEPAQKPQEAEKKEEEPSSETDESSGSTASNE
jgi:hypothetical protein